MVILVLQCKNVMRMGYIVTIFLMLISASAIAEDSIADRVIDSYNSLDSYCDTIIKKDHQYTYDVERCYTKDGSYKFSEYTADKLRFGKVQWGDKDYSYRWHTVRDKTNHYAKERARSHYAGGLPEGLAARVFLPFLRGNKLIGMEVVEENEETILLQRQRLDPGGTARVNSVWVRKSDNFILRSEETWDGKVAWSATLVEARANPSLSDDDLTVDVPFSKRYFRFDMNNPNTILIPLCLFGMIGFILYLSAGSIISGEKFRKSTKMFWITIILPFFPLVITYTALYLRSFIMYDKDKTYMVALFMLPIAILAGFIFSCIHAYSSWPKRRPLISLMINSILFLALLSYFREMIFV